jgi:hypothetical protein
VDQHRLARVHRRGNFHRIRAIRQTASAPSGNSTLRRVSMTVRVAIGPTSSSSAAKYTIWPSSRGPTLSMPGIARWGSLARRWPPALSADNAHYVKYAIGRRGLPWRRSSRRTDVGADPPARRAGHLPAAPALDRRLGSGRPGQPGAPVRHPQGIQAPSSASPMARLAADRLRGRDRRHDRRQWIEQREHTAGFDTRMAAFHGTTWAVSRLHPTVDAAIYPQAVPLTRILRSPHWLAAGTCGEYRCQQQFGDEVRRTVAPAYRWPSSPPDSRDPLLAYLRYREHRTASGLPQRASGPVGRLRHAVGGAQLLASVTRSCPSARDSGQERGLWADDLARVSPQRVGRSGATLPKREKPRAHRVQGDGHRGSPLFSNWTIPRITGGSH